MLDGTFDAGQNLSQPLRETEQLPDFGMWHTDGSND